MYAIIRFRVFFLFVAVLVIVTKFPNTAAPDFNRIVVIYFICRTTYVNTVDYTQNCCSVRIETIIIRILYKIRFNFIALSITVMFNINRIVASAFKFIQRL